METMLGILFLGVAAVCAAAMLVPPQTDKRSARRHRRRRREQEREAHYMRNFWNYDGSAQEDFEE